MSDQAFYQIALRHELQRRCQANPSYSLRSFARAMKISPGSLSLILSGKRVPSQKLVKALMANLTLNPEQTDSFVESVRERHVRRNLKRKTFFNRDGEKAKAKQPDGWIEAETFQVISEWYHYAIMMLMETPGAKADPRWIAKELGISHTEAVLALKRLIELKLLKKKNGRWTIDASYLTTADKEKSTAAHRRHQKQILEKAIYSLENDGLERRSTTSLTMAIDPAKLPEAKKMIEEMSRKLCELLESGERTEVYQLGISLFPLQKGAR